MFAQMTAVVTGILLLSGGVALFGLLKKQLLESMLQSCQSYERELKKTKADIVILKAEIAHLKADAALRTMQLNVSLRVIEYFERVVTVYVKNRDTIAKTSKSVVQQIDAALQELTKYREQATLDLESQEINQQHYEWLLTREVIMGPRYGPGTQEATGEPCAE